MAPVRPVPTSRSRSNSAVSKSRPTPNSSAARPGHRRAKTCAQSISLYPDSTPDGLPTLESYKAAEAGYLFSLSVVKRSKALIDLPLFQNIWNVLSSPDENQSDPACTPQFRFWVKKMFTIQPAPVEPSESPSLPDSDPIMLLFHDNKPVAVRDKVYEILCIAHNNANHGGRDRTDAVARSVYSYIPKDLVNRFVSICPTCRHKKARYRHLPRITVEAAAEEEVLPQDNSGDEFTEPNENAPLESAAFVPGSVVRTQEDSPLDPSRSARSDTDTEHNLPVILGWTGSTTAVPNNDIHLAEVARSVFSSSHIHRSNSESDSQPLFLRGGPDNRLGLSPPPRYASPIHLRPILSPNPQNTATSSHLPGLVATSETLSLPSLRTVIPSDLRTGLGVASQISTPHRPTWIQNGEFALPPLSQISGPSGSERGSGIRERCWTPSPTQSMSSGTKNVIEPQIDSALLVPQIDMRSKFLDISLGNASDRPNVGQTTTSAHICQAPGGRRLVAQEITNATSPQSPRSPSHEKIAVSARSTGSPAVSSPSPSGDYHTFSKIGVENIPVSMNQDRIHADTDGTSMEID